MKKYIVWINYGYEGWAPTEFETLEEAIKYSTHQNYGAEFKITKLVDFEIKEIEEN